MARYKAHRDYEDLSVMQEWWDGREAGFQVRRVFCLFVYVLAFLLKEGAVRELSINLPKRLPMSTSVEVPALLPTRRKMRSTRGIELQLCLEEKLYRVCLDL